MSTDSDIAHADWNGHRWECRWLGDDCYSVLCLDPAFDYEEIDQTDWPSDEQVSTLAGAWLRWSDAGDSNRGVEGVYMRVES